MKVILKDGQAKSMKTAWQLSTLPEISAEGLARVACAAELDGKVVDLRTVVDGEHELNILTFDSEEGKRAFRHTASHVLAQAVKRLYPQQKAPSAHPLKMDFTMILIWNPWTVPHWTHWKRDEKDRQRRSIH